MAVLTADVRAFITQALACFDTPSQVAEAVKINYGVIVPRQQVEQHDPEKFAGRLLGAKWKALFYESREKFKAQTQDIPIANRAYRLRALGRMADKAESMRNLPLAAQLMEQAAKEMGEMYVNRRTEVEKPLANQAGEQTATVEYKLEPDENVPATPHL